MQELKWSCDLDLPQMYRKHRTDACLDICCAEDVVVPPFPDRVAVKTALHIAIPSGCDGKIEPRSGLALHHGITVLGGQIDAGFRGEVIVILAAFNREPVTLPAGSRIAQLVVRELYKGPVTRVAFEQLGEGDRGANGFGSTGVTP